MEAEIIASLVEAVAALNRRVNDLGSFELIAGPQGLPGANGEPGPPPTDEAIREAATAWLAANITQPTNGTDGTDGTDGRDGEDGAPGRPPTEQEIELAVDIWLTANRAALRGTDGRDGRDGVDGRDGSDGADGAAGSRGAAGPQGVGIALVEQRDEESFWVTLDDGREFEIELPKQVVQYIGGGGAPTLAYLSAVDKQTQNAPINTARAMEFDTTIESFNISIVDNVKITFGVSGLFNIQFSAQLNNEDSQEHDVSIWIARDGINEPDSCGDILVAARHGNYNGAVIAAWNFYYRAQKGEYCRILWSTPDALVYIAGLPERIAPVRPATPSVILTVNRVAS